MLIDGFEKKNFGIVPAKFKAMDVEFSYSLATYNEIAHHSKRDIMEIIEQGENSTDTLSDDSDHKNEFNFIDFIILRQDTVLMN